MEFVDIHNHALWGIDDGPETREQTYTMLEEAYRQGTRMICFTPHLHPGIYPADDALREQVFRQVQEHARTRYPDLKLYLAGELYYSRGCTEWLSRCRHGCIGRKYVLVDFSSGEGGERILRGLQELMSNGYLPILAHGERYVHLPLSRMEQLRRKGILIQADTQSFFGGFGLKARFRVLQMLKRDLIDFVSSDAHDSGSRPVDMRPCWLYIKRKKGAECAEALCASNARHLLYTAFSDSQ